MLKGSGAPCLQSCFQGPFTECLCQSQCFFQTLKILVYISNSIKTIIAIEYSYKCYLWMVFTSNPKRFVPLTTTSMETYALERVFILINLHYVNMWISYGVKTFSCILLFILRESWCLSSNIFCINVKRCMQSYLLWFWILSQLLVTEVLQIWKWAYLL